ncbi:MAG: hypothetical protein GSR79_01105 [Desulfurococcales archaeon]|nr:hypothetical protein [Desulfurococcales archaeon]
MTSCILDPTKDVIMETVKEIADNEPNGILPRELHSILIRKLNNCEDLYTVNGSWSPIIDRAIQVLLDSELGYLDGSGNLHVSKVGKSLLA